MSKSRSRSRSRGTGRGKPRPYIIESASAIRLLASPLRQAIVDAIVARGSSTIVELSRLLHRPADRLYYHVRLLQRAGLLIASDGRAVRGRAEARFDVPGRPMSIRYEPGSATNRRAVGRVVDGMMSSARRDFRAAIESKSANVQGPFRNLWAGRAQGALSPADVRELNALIVRITELMRRSSRSEAADRHSHQFTWIFSRSSE
jgi:hypothetical protein